MPLPLPLLLMCPPPGLCNADATCGLLPVGGFGSTRASGGLGSVRAGTAADAEDERTCSCWGLLEEPDVAEEEEEEEEDDDVDVDEDDDEEALVVVVMAARAELDCLTGGADAMVVVDVEKGLSRSSG